MESTTQILPQNRRTTWDILLDNALYCIIALLIAIIIIMDSSFFNIRNFTTILSQSATRIIFAIGIGGIIVLGGTDLSLGRSVGLAAVFSASLLQNPTYARRVFDPEVVPLLPVVVVLIMTMILLAFFSTLQGVVVAKLGVAPFIASLGFQLIIYGVCSLYFNGPCNANSISGLAPTFSRFAQGKIVLTKNFSISYLMIYAAIVVAVMSFVWYKTVLGRYMFAIGGNRESAKVCGVPVVISMLLVYAIAGALYGFGGMLEAARAGSAVNSTGIGYEMDAIAACVAGGVSMRGGTGSILGIVLGVIIFQIISYGLIYVGISPDMQYVIKGAIILVAVIIDSRKSVRNSA